MRCSRGHKEGVAEVIIKTGTQGEAGTHNKQVSRKKG